MTEDKNTFRRRILETQPPVNGDRVVENVLSHPWFSQAACVMAYCSIPPEIDLMPVLETALKQGKTLVLPRCEPGGHMTPRQVHSLEELVLGSYGILEPGQNAVQVPEQQIDLILVPGLAFDGMGHRLGRGKGYYDRFLSRTSAKTMGICRYLVPEVPVEPHDISMNALVTEHNIITCEREDCPCSTRTMI